jgi:hypothetical protein
VNLHGGSWSGAGVAGRRGTRGTQADEEAYRFRPTNTAGSNRSYTFGAPGFNAAAAVGTGLEVPMQERPASTQPPRSPLGAQNNGKVS